MGPSHGGAEPQMRRQVSRYVSLISIFDTHISALSLLEVESGFTL